METKLITTKGVPHEVINDMFLTRFIPLEKSPVVMSLPHDGLKDDVLGILFVQEKEDTKTIDCGTEPIATELLLHAPVYQIRNLMSRGCLDSNRSQENAYEDEQFAPIYKAYYDNCVAFIQKALKDFGKSVLFIDFHGFGEQPDYGEYDLILGTGNRVTVTIGYDKIFNEFMEAKDYKVFLPKEMPIISGKKDRYSGGHTIHHIFKATGIDAIQLEVSSDIRNTPERMKKLAKDIADFINRIIDGTIEVRAGKKLERFNS